MTECGYQFQVDGRPAGPIRTKWKHAAQDAVSAGCASWKRGGTAVGFSECADVVRIELFPSEPATVRRADYLQKDAAYKLNSAAQVIREAYPDSLGVYLVGSVLERPDFRDVDVRCILMDEDFDALFPGLNQRNETKQAWHPRFSLLCFSISLWLRDMTGLPIDFQFQRMTQANEKYGRESGRRRNAIGTGLVSAPDAA